MGIGVGIFFIAVGAILAFAVDAQVSGIELETIGFILIGAGVLGIILELLLFAPRRRNTLVAGTAVPVAQQPAPYGVDENGRPIQ